MLFANDIVLVDETDTKLVLRRQESQGSQPIRLRTEYLERKFSTNKNVGIKFGETGLEGVNYRDASSV